MDSMGAGIKPIGEGFTGVEELKKQVNSSSTNNKLPIGGKKNTGMGGKALLYPMKSSQKPVSYSN